MNERILDAARKVVKLQELKLDNDPSFTEYLMNGAIHNLNQEIIAYDCMDTEVNGCWDAKTI